MVHLQGLLVASAIGAAALPAQAGQPQVDQAVLFLRAACGLKDARLETGVQGDGRLHMRLSTGSVVRGTTNLVGRDLEIFADATNRVQATQSFEMVQCLEPMFAKVTMTLQSLPQDVASLPVGSGQTAAAGGGAYVPPMLPAPGPAVTQAPAPVVAVATPAPAAVAAGGNEVAFALQGCRSSGRIVVCDVRVNNGTQQDYNVIVQARQTVLYDPNGGAYHPEDIRMGNQRGPDAWGVAKMRVIADTAPMVSIAFHRVPETVSSAKRLEVSIGIDTPNGVRMQKLTLADFTVQGR
ncbi:MAG: hypothetical protein WC760_13810 [Bacteroidia bacterium]|jgi:hypothetical protein